MAPLRRGFVISAILLSMHFFDYALRDLPSNLHRNTGGSVFTDIALPSGTNTATISTFGVPLVTGSSKSAVVGTAVGAASYGFAEKNFVAGREYSEFTLSIVALPSVLTQELSLLSHTTSSPLDGIVITKDFIIFRVRFNAGVSEVKYEYDDMPDSFLIHATYMSSAIKLYVNGNLVGTTEIDATYPASGFITSGDGTLYAGKGTGTADKAFVDAPASYPSALTDEQIMRQYKAMIDVVPMLTNVNAFGGVTRNGSERRISHQQVFNSADSWEAVSFTDVSYNSGELIPNVDQSTGASKAGVWIGQYAIENPDAPVLAGGVKAEWNGNGSYTVQASIDGGTTWSNINNGELITSTMNLNANNKVLLIKITFTGGVVGDVSEVKNMTLTTYADNVIYTSGNNARKINLVSLVSTSLKPNEPIERNTMPGIHVYGNTATMAQDADESPVSIQTLEFWVNPKGTAGATGGYIFDTRGYGGTAYMWIAEASGNWGWAGASAVYINGVAVSSGLAAKKNEWNHVVFVFPAAFNTQIALFGGQQLAEYNLIANYPTALTAQQVAQLYANYQGMPVMPVTEVGTVTFAEPATPYVFTVADWANLPQQ